MKHTLPRFIGKLNNMYVLLYLVVLKERDNAIINLLVPGFSHGNIILNYTF